MIDLLDTRDIMCHYNFVYMTEAKAEGCIYLKGMKRKLVHSEEEHKVYETRYDLRSSSWGNYDNKMYYTGVSETNVLNNVVVGPDCDLVLQTDDGILHINFKDYTRLSAQGRPINRTILECNMRLIIL